MLYVNTPFIVRSQRLRLSFHIAFYYVKKQNFGLCQEKGFVVVFMLEKKPRSISLRYQIFNIFFRKSFFFFLPFMNEAEICLRFESYIGTILNIYDKTSLSFYMKAESTKRRTFFSFSLNCRASFYGTEEKSLRKTTAVSQGTWRSFNEWSFSSCLFQHKLQLDIFIVIPLSHTQRKNWDRQENHKEFRQKEKKKEEKAKEKNKISAFLYAWRNAYESLMRVFMCSFIRRQFSYIK